MPIETHPSFEPPSEEIPLWRYMDLAKLGSLLSTSSLWFASGETLALDDPHEAVLPAANYAHRLWKRPEDVPPDDLERIIASSYGPKDNDSLDYKISREKWNREHALLSAFVYRKEHLINCWHALPHESVAMWKIYSTPGYGVSIKSSPAQVREAFRANQDRIMIGRVRYRTEDDPPIDPSNGFNSVVTKRAQFSYEHEVRLVHWAHSTVDKIPLLWDENEGQFSYPEGIEKFINAPALAGKAISIDLAVLISEIVISPFSPPWIDDVVRSLCLAFGLSAPISRSTLLDRPIR